MSTGKKVRAAVYEKYNGHCAYCGKKIRVEDMQVDHFVPLRGWNEAGSNELCNLMPACRRCNHYKRAHNLETFRRYIEEIPLKLKENYIYKVGLDYGLITEHENPIKFYFELQEE